MSLSSLAVSSAVVAYLVVFSLYHADDVGPADAVTLFRAGLVAYVAGYVVVRPEGAEAWLVAAVFALATGLDAVDGAVARRTRSTALGERLDIEADALGLLVGVSVGVAHGWLPAVYLIVGAARYVFVAGVVLRRWRGLGVGTLSTSYTRNALSVAQTAVVLGALVPAVPPEVTRPAAVVAMVPFVVWFARDYVVVCRKYDYTQT